MSRCTPPLLLAGLLLCASHLHAQLSLPTVVDLAVRASPRVKSAEADVARARAALSESRDAYVPSLSAGAALGEGLGYSPNPPTLFQLNAQSLLYNASQRFYVRSARAALQSASYTLGDVSETVAADAATTYVDLDHDLERNAAFEQEFVLSQGLVTIVSDRVAAGVDSPVDLTNARLDAARLHQRILLAGDDTENDRDHLARLLGIPAATLRIVSGFPDLPLLREPATQLGGPANLSVAAAFSNAESKRQQALGDSHYLYRPQLSFFVQYQRYATFTDSFKQLETFESGGQLKADGSPARTIAPNEEAFGVQITFPLFDKARAAHARATMAEAAHALHEAESAQISVLDGQSRQAHQLEEAQAEEDIAALEQQQAQQQLEAIRIQLAGTGPGSPKDEQTARLHERDQYIHLLDVTLDLRRAKIDLLRQNGQLEEWLRRVARATADPAPGSSIP